MQVIQGGLIGILGLLFPSPASLDRQLPQAAILGWYLLLLGGFITGVAALLWHGESWKQVHLELASQVAMAVGPAVYVGAVISASGARGAIVAAFLAPWSAASAIRVIALRHSLRHPTEQPKATTQ
jgi:hypothetical protein